MNRTPIRRLVLAVALVLIGPAGASAQSTFWRQARDPALARYRRELAAARELIDSTERGERERRELRERRLRAALDRLGRAIQAAPNEVEARYRRAGLLFDMDQFALAATDLESARRIDPQSDWAEEIEFRLGVVYTKLGRFQEALAAFDAHLRLGIAAGARSVGYGIAAEHSQDGLSGDASASQRYPSQQAQEVMGIASLNPSYDSVEAPPPVTAADRMACPVPD